MIKLATVFSGIGAVEHAMGRLKDQKVLDYETIFACDNGERELEKTFEEIEKEIQGLSDKDINIYIKNLYESTKKKNYVKESYFANYTLSEEQWYEDIRFLNGNKYQGKVNFLVGGSPCQSFSIMGKRKGLTDERGILVFEFIRLVNEIQPKVFVFENVPGMLTHDKGLTWYEIYYRFSSIGYRVFPKVLNALDYGIPQDRKRLFVVGFRDNISNFEFPNKMELTKRITDFLEDQVDFDYYLGQKGFEFVTGLNNSNRARVCNDLEYIKTQRANQQYNWNGDFVFEELDLNKHDQKILSRAYVGEYNGRTGVIRQLTNKECFRLMGFSDNFNIVVPKMQAYRQAGNSIVVNVLEELIKSIQKVVDFNE